MNNEKDFERITSVETDKQKEALEEAIEMMKESMEKVPLSEFDIKFYEILGLNPETAEIDECLERIDDHLFDILELCGIPLGLEELLNESDDLDDDNDFLDDLLNESEDLIDDDDSEDGELVLLDYFNDDLEDSE